METETRQNSFIASLEELQSGAVASDLDRQLREIVLAARETGKKGSLTLTLNVEPRGADSVIVSADLKPKIPVAEQPPSIFFVNDDGSLGREHPKQTNLPFQTQTA